MIIPLLNLVPKNFTIINMENKITLSFSEQQEVELFCKLNNITIEELLKKSFKTGYNIEKYGLIGDYDLRKMGGTQEKWVEKEVIQEKWVEIPVEVIKEVIKIEYVDVPVEVIKYVDKEIIKEVLVEKIVTIYDKSDDNELLLKIHELETERQEFSTKITEMLNERQEFSTKTIEMENIFQNKMSKKEQELAELRQTLEKPQVDDNSQQLQMTIQNLMKNLRDKNIEIDELKKQITEQQKNNDIYERAKYLRSSNLDDNIYK